MDAFGNTPNPNNHLQYEEYYFSEITPNPKPAMALPGATGQNTLAIYTSSTDLYLGPGFEMSYPDLAACEANTAANPSTTVIYKAVKSLPKAWTWSSDGLVPNPNIFYITAIYPTGIDPLDGTPAPWQIQLNYLNGMSKFIMLNDENDEFYLPHFYYMSYATDDTCIKSYLSSIFILNDQGTKIYEFYIINQSYIKATQEDWGKLV